MKTLTDQNITLAKPFGKYIGVDISMADWSVPEEIADDDSECIESNEHLFLISLESKLQSKLMENLSTKPQ